MAGKSSYSAKGIVPEPVPNTDDTEEVTKVEAGEYENTPMVMRWDIYGYSCVFLSFTLSMLSMVSRLVLPIGRAVANKTRIINR